MHIYQYMRLHCRYITKESASEYNITDNFFDSKGYIYLEIRKVMYGLKEAAILAYKQLCVHLAKSGYHPMKHTPGLWRHESCLTTFTLAVDNFGMKYFIKSDATHLFQALGENIHLQLTGLAAVTFLSPSIGTTTLDMSTFPCLTMSPRLLKNSTIVHQNAHRMLLVPRHLPSMAKRFSMQPRINLHPWIKKEHSLFKPSLELSFITPELFILQFSPLSTKFQTNNLRPPSAPKSLGQSAHTSCCHNSLLCQWHGFMTHFWRCLSCSPRCTQSLCRSLHVNKQTSHLPS